MGSEWQMVPFNKAVQINPPVKLKRGKIYPFVEMKAVESSRRDATESEVREFTNGGSRFMPYDTLMARITPCLENGKIARFIPSSNFDSPAFGSTEFIVIRGREGVTDNSYAYYLTKWKEFRQFAISQMSGSTGRQRVPYDSLNNFFVPLPILEHQKAIAHVLSTLDDKIELNRQMNATLESMAQAMFKSWFVDFDPVIDNALTAGNPIPEPLKPRAENRRRLGDQRKPLPQDIQKLFPDSFVFTEELGWIPEGWEVGKLSDIAELKTQSVKPDKKSDKKWVHFSIPAFDQNKTPHIDIGHSIKSGKYRVPKTSVLASKLNPQFPRVWLPEVEDENSSICSTEFMPFIPLNAEERSYLYTFFCSEKIQVEIANRVTGSTGSRQRVKPSEIAEMTILKVPQSIRADFSIRANSILSKQANNINEQSLLSNLRDTLLPKLISGQLRLPDSLIDKFAEQPNSPDAEQIISEAI